jgi:hypothetical protein
MKRLRVILCITAVILSILVQGQSVSRQVLSEGGSTTLSGEIILCWTLGQPGPVETATLPELIITQGFQQVDEAYVGINEEKWADGQLKIYPNPSTGTFKLEGYLNGPGKISFIIYNTYANPIVKGDIEVSSDGTLFHEFNLTECPSGVYLLNLISSPQSELYQGIHSFRLIKIY